MSIEVRAIQPDEFGDFCRGNGRVWGFDVSDRDIERTLLNIQSNDVVAAFDGPSMVGGIAARSQMFRVPGAWVRATTAPAVWVLPTHQRRGILRSFVMSVRDRAREQGIALSAIIPAESGIYGRFGFGTASYIATSQIDRRASSFGTPLEDTGEVTYVTPGEALELLPAVYEQLDYPGLVQRTSDWWRFQYGFGNSSMGAAGPRTFAVHRTNERVDGYVVYRVTGRSGDGGPEHLLTIEDLVSLTPAAYGALWRSCFDQALVRCVEARRRPTDEPLLRMLAEPRQLRQVITDDLSIRLIDVAAALMARRYALTGTIVIEVRDELCPWNDGTMQLEVGESGANCVPVSSPPHVSLDVGALSALYLGDADCTALAGSGRVVPHTPDAITRLGALFQWSPGPWMPHYF